MWCTRHTRFSHINFKAHLHFRLHALSLSLSLLHTHTLTHSLSHTQEALTMAHSHWRTHALSRATCRWTRHTHTTQRAVTSARESETHFARVALTLWRRHTLVRERCVRVRCLTERLPARCVEALSECVTETLRERLLSLSHSHYLTQRALTLLRRLTRDVRARRVRATHRTHTHTLSHWWLLWRLRVRYTLSPQHNALSQCDLHYFRRGAHNVLTQWRRTARERARSARLATFSVSLSLALRRWRTFCEQRTFHALRVVHARIRRELTVTQRALTFWHAVARETHTEKIRMRVAARLLSQTRVAVWREKVRRVFVVWKTEFIAFSRNCVTWLKDRERQRETLCVRFVLRVWREVYVRRLCERDTLCEALCVWRENAHRQRVCRERETCVRALCAQRSLRRVWSVWSTQTSLALTALTQRAAVVAQLERLSHSVRRTQTRVTQRAVARALCAWLCVAHTRRAALCALSLRVVWTRWQRALTQRTTHRFLATQLRLTTPSHRRSHTQRETASVSHSTASHNARGERERLAREQTRLLRQRTLRAREIDATPSQRALTTHPHPHSSLSQERGESDSVVSEDSLSHTHTSVSQRAHTTPRPFSARVCRPTQAHTQHVAHTPHTHHTPATQPHREKTHVPRLCVDREESLRDGYLRTHLRRSLSQL